MSSTQHWNPGAGDAGAFSRSFAAERYPGLFYCLLLASACILLYAPFLSSPYFFDDLNFFQWPQVLAEGGLATVPRWFPYWTLGATYRHFGTEPAPFRIGNLLLHIGVAIALFRLARDLLGAARPGRANARPAFVGALLFALHPVAVFAAGYLIQRTILFATLFCLLMWWSTLRACLTRRPAWFYLSAVFYLLAVYSKEHAVMAPAVSLAVWLWLQRSRGGSRSPDRALAKHLYAVCLLYGLVAASIAARYTGFLAAPVEPFASQLLTHLPIDPERVYPLSLVTQMGLFFKYLGLWLIPNPVWMSVDIREPIAAAVVSWQGVLGPLAFVGFCLASAGMLWRGGLLGLAGLALWIPAVMFAPELLSVRIQEPFVLYRSYLWLPVTTALSVSGVLLLLGRGAAVLVSSLLAIGLALLAANQLFTFSQPLFLWDQAVRLTEGREGVVGVDRIYHNRGLAYYELGFREEAIQDYRKAIALAPELPYSYNNLAATLYDLKRYPEAMENFNRTLSILPAAHPYMGRGLTHLALGDREAALKDLRSACELKFKAACKKVLELDGEK